MFFFYFEFFWVEILTGRVYGTKSKMIKVYFKVTPKFELLNVSRKNIYTGFRRIYLGLKIVKW